MKNLARSLCLACFVVSVSSPALAQQWSGGYSTSQGGYGSGYAPPRNDVDNIGAEDGQFVFGFERITGLSFDRHTVTYDTPSGEEHKDTFKSTSLNLLGVDSSSPSQLPRFGFDYVIAQGFTAGASLLFSTRSYDLDAGSVGESAGQLPTVRPEGTTFLGALRAGYAYPIDETFGVWPRAGISYATSTADFDVVDGTTGEIETAGFSASYFDLNLEALAVISPVEHIAVLAGPYLDLGLGGKYKQDLGGEDKRNATLTSFGLIVHAVGYY